MGELMASVVYILCILTSALCAWMLGRMYLRLRMRMLLWSTLCFFLFAIVNLLVVIDLLIWPEVDFRPARYTITLIAVGSLLFGFIWDQED